MYLTGKIPGFQAAALFGPGAHNQDDHRPVAAHMGGDERRKSRRERDRESDIDIAIGIRGANAPLFNVATGILLVTDVAIDAGEGRSVLVADRAPIQAPLATQFDEVRGVTDAELDRPKRAVTGLDDFGASRVDGQHAVSGVDDMDCAGMGKSIDGRQRRRVRRGAGKTRHPAGDTIGIVHGISFRWYFAGSRVLATQDCTSSYQ